MTPVPRLKLPTSMRTCRKPESWWGDSHLVPAARQVAPMNPGSGSAYTEDGEFVRTVCRRPASHVHHLSCVEAASRCRQRDALNPILGISI